MRAKEKVLYASVIASGALLASMVTPFIPCRTSPAVPNPTFTWSLCDLNPDTFPASFAVREYFGYTTSILDAYFLLVITAFILALVIFKKFTRKE